MFTYLQNLDTSILLFIQEHIRNPILTPIFKFITGLGNAGMIWIFIIFLLLCYRKSRKTGIAALITIVICFIINNIMIKNFAARPRPFTMIQNLQILIAKPTDFSFPSGHTAISFAVAGAIFFAGNKKFGIGAFVLASAIGFSRLYLGVHYPSDVICGILVGLLTSLCVSKVFVYSQDKLKGNVISSK